MIRNRRKFLRDVSLLALGPQVGIREVSTQGLASAIVIDPRPLFDISPYLYMQFMEPLGDSDGSVEAGWDHQVDDWRKDLIDVVKDLSPGVVRYGGIFSRYYKWREGVGPAKSRPVMRNYAWAGTESNRVGTVEFVDFCRRIGAEPLMSVNFRSDGDKQLWKTDDGQDRSGDAAEAADWVSYTNDPDNRERKAHGISKPVTIKLWQLGNETSYGTHLFTLAEAVRETNAFAKAMKERDPSIQLIGWGDRGPRPDRTYWAGDLIKQAGEHLNYVAMHMMGQSPIRENTVLNGAKYEEEPEQAWDELRELADQAESRISEFEQVVSTASPTMGIAVTEGHLSLKSQHYNANPILYHWITGIYHARSMNIYQRHGARVKIATAADFCGTRWTVNAVMIPDSSRKCYLMPVGSVMRLFKRRNGTKGIEVKSAPSDLDIAASRSGDRIFLHVANMSYKRGVETRLDVAGMTVTGGRVLEIAPENALARVSEGLPNVFDPVERILPAGPAPRWHFPATSVSVVELEVKS